MAQLFTAGIFTGLDNAGNPLAGGRLHTYRAGTTTPLVTYTTQAATVPNTNPVILDSAGRAAVWLGAEAYRMRLETAGGSLVWETDNYRDASNAPSIGYEAYSIAADGNTDDTARVRLWLAAAAAAGVWADGGGKTIAISGDLDISSYTALKLRDVTFKELAPTGANRKTLYAANNAMIHLLRVQVLRNGNGSSGNLSTTAGMWFSACDDLVLEDCDVSGNNKGTGIALHSCARSNVIRPYVHDMRYAHTSETDDSVQGVWFNNCTRFSCTAPRIERMGRIAQNVAERDRFSRGVVVSGCVGGIINNPQIFRVDQAIDVTGSAGNRGIVVDGGSISHVCSAGVKFANTAVACGAFGVVVEHSGYYGFLASGPISGVTNATQDIVFDGCVSRNNGSAQLFSASNIRAFSAERGTGSSAPFASYPKAIKFRGCDAIADEGTSAVTIASASALNCSSPIPASLGVRVRFTTSGTLPNGLATGTDYWLVPIPDTLTVGVATSYINALDGIVLSAFSGGTGTHTMTLFQDLYDGFFNNVSTVDIDNGKPNTAENCRSNGHTNLSFSGLHAPIVISNRDAQSIPNNSFSDLLPTNDVADSMALHDATTPSANYYVPISGMWAFEASGLFAANGTGTRRLKIQADTTGTGSSFADVGTLDVRAAISGVATAVTTRYEAFVPRGTLFKAQAFQDSGGALNCDIRVTMRPAAVFAGTI